MSLYITRHIRVPMDEIDMQAVRSQGSGGQNVNKVSTAVHLRFDIQASSLPDAVKQKLLKLKDRRISKDGVVVIKAQSQRSQERNREEALMRLQHLIQAVLVSPRARKATRPTRASKEKRLAAKARLGRRKSLRRKVSGSGED